MSTMFESWTQEKHCDLFQALTGYWAEDIWDLRMCPINLPLGYLENSRFLRFECPSPNVNTELKYVCWKKVIQGDWKVNQNLQSRIHSLLVWMKSYLPASTQSLTERPLYEWEQSYSAFQVAKGCAVVQKSKHLMASQQLKEFTQARSEIYALRQVYQELEKIYDTRSEFEKDIWDFRHLGVRICAGRADYTANFTPIQQPWLRKLAKTCLRYRLTTHSASDCFNKLRALKAFAFFLAKHHPHATPADISRDVLIEFFGFLQAEKISATTRIKYIGDLRTILELAVRLSWVNDLPKSQFIFTEDIPRRTLPVPRFIPDPVVKQIFLHLEKLETHWQRMFVVAYEVGMRVNELLSLPFNCLMQDATGSWWIQFLQGKVKSEHRQLVSKEAAAIIQVQQMEVQAQFCDQPKLLFPDPKGKCYQSRLFRKAINLFIIQNNIRDVSGTLWRFQPHQLRHSFGTRHINEGMPPTLLMRMMGHRNLSSTARYAYIHDQTLRAEFEKSRQNHKLVDITGRMVTEDSPVDSPGLQWLKSHLDARTLPNGFCSIPVVLGPCPHPNSCLTCPHFRTDRTQLPIHEAQLAETSRLIQIARVKGWKTQIENNELIAKNLTTIIASLKEKNDDTQTQR